MTSHFKKAANKGNKNSNSKVSLRLIGFGTQKIISIATIVEAINILPDNHISGLQEVIYDPQRVNQKSEMYFREPDQFGPLPSFRSQGEFHLNTRKIYIYDFNSIQTFTHVLYHEIGHYVFYNVIDSRIKHQWTTKIHSSSTHITPEAAKNASEGFAECYAAYISSHSQLKSLNAKYNFMRDYIFSGLTYN